MSDDYWQLTIYDKEGDEHIEAYTQRSMAVDAATRWFKSHELFDAFEMVGQVHTWQDWNEAIEKALGEWPQHQIRIERKEVRDGVDDDYCYDRRIVQLKDRYHDRVVEMLGDGAVETGADPVRWEVWGDGTTTAVTIREQGDTMEITFVVTVTGDDGQLIREFAPHNFTERCWVNMWDDAAIETRFQEVFHAYS